MRKDEMTGFTAAVPLFEMFAFVDANARTSGY